MRVTCRLRWQAATIKATELSYRGTCASTRTPALALVFPPSAHPLVHLRDCARPV